MTLKKAFNWMAQKPQAAYTLAELYNQATGRPDLHPVDDRRLNFTRAGRIYERIHTGIGALEATIALATIASPPAAMATALVTLCFWKALGLGMGKVVDRLVRDGDRALNGPKP
jgi:hypothetical protein